MAATFGKQVAEKIGAISDVAAIPIVEVPGDFPYKDRNPPNPISPTTQEDVCTLCETCASVCPTGAITVAESVVTVGEKCILCCACVKNCPSEARVMDHPAMEKAAKWLNSSFSDRKEPKLFI